MVARMRYYKGENDDLPSTTEEWQIDFNADIFNSFEDDSIAVKYEVKEEETASRNKKDKSTTRMQFRMSDYPYFYGTASVWPGVKENFKVFLEDQGQDELVNIKDEDAHGLKIDVKEGYEDSN